ncbi:Phytosulfokines 5 [Hordeum vulgare]|nr:Phytosulfokines 5 [Hordeum vulgare]
MVVLAPEKQKEDINGSDNSGDKQIRLGPSCISDCYFHEKDGKDTRIFVVASIWLRRCSEHLTDTVWMQINWCIIRCLLTSASDKTRGMVNHHNPIGHTLWTATRQLFLFNCNQCIPALKEFHSLIQNYLSITEYCLCLQNLADTLVDCGMSVID